MKEIKKIALMAVGDDSWQGGIQYIINIIGALDAIAEEYPVDLHLFKGPAQRFDDLARFKNIDIRVHDLESELEPWTLANRVKWFAQRKWRKRVYPRLETYLLRNQFDYVFPTAISDCNKKLNAGSWIADFQYKHFPDGANPSVNKSAHRVISFIAQKTPKIILSSHFCETDSWHFFPETKGKTHVMPFAVSLDKNIFASHDFGQVRKKYSLPERFLIVSNLFAPTKNHKTLFNALGLLHAKGIKVDLICTGNIVDYRNQLYANEILQSLTDNKIRGQVHLLGLIPRVDQLALYRMSTGMVQPSVNEGWSTLVEEAKALGKNLALSDIAVHKEQYPDNPYFFNSMDAEDLAEVIERMWQSSAATSFPDLDAEQNAFAAYEEKIRQFGRRFLEIGRL